LLLQAAQRGDESAFERLVRAHRRELLAHCYRMLGSLQDAEDALQETLVAAWRGLGGFRGESSLRSWLYRIATTRCLRVVERRPPRLLSWEHGASRDADDELGDAVMEPIWLEPWPTDPAEALERRETIGLAFIAALQHLSPNQRAVLILRDVLAFSAEETAAMLDTSVASVTSALQRARARMGSRELELSAADWSDAQVQAFLGAWEAADVKTLVGMLAADCRFTMPPLPAWFDGREAVAAFLDRRVFATPWKLLPVVANAQPGFACYQWNGQSFRLGAVNVLSIRDDGVGWIAAFLDPQVLARFDVPQEILPRAIS